MHLPELLAPAGSNEELETALHYGADAAYLGLSQFSLRAKADNFSEDELEGIAKRIQNSGKKLYVTVNIFPHNRDIAFIREHLARLKQIAPDGVIVSDIGVFDMVSDVTPELPIHVSTQANLTNYKAAAFWERLGAKRLVLSRELSIEEIKEIRDHVSIELECFVHGAICISYSGRCYISSFLSGRSANRGECTNSCRWSYALMEEKREGRYYPVYEDSRGAFLMSSRDLCMIEHLDKLADAGVNSFKVEGRMKGINYVAGVIKTYREAIDTLKERPYIVKKQWLEELSRFSNRGYTTGMFLGTHPDDGYNFDETKIYRMTHELVGVVDSVENGVGRVSLRNNLKVGDRVEFLSTGLEGRTIEVSGMSYENGEETRLARNEEKVFIPMLNGVRKNDLVRRRKV